MTSLLKSSLGTSIAKAVYNEIQNRTSRYYYFLGKTLAWDSETDPPLPVDSAAYDMATRNEIITLKEVTSTDVAFVVPRIDWTSGSVWDMYDDQYSTEVQGISLTAGGNGYAAVPNITIIGNGTGATAVATIANGSIRSIDLTSRGIGYTTTPQVLIDGGGGSGASALATITKAPSGAQQLEHALSYVMTDEFNVYRCIDNNNGGISTVRPTGTTVDPIMLGDGYTWKYLYSIPIALRNKFLTTQYAPVVNSLRSQFYSGGEIVNTPVMNGGSGYTYANLQVVGDGYSEANPFLLTQLHLSSGGSGYTSGATLSIASPIAGANAWVASSGVLLGQHIEYNNNVYEVTLSGILGITGPTHKSSIAANGTAALKYVGTRATGTLTTSGGTVTGFTLNGNVGKISVSSPGFGYTTPPTITVTGSGSGFVGQCIMSGSGVGGFKILDSGSYTSTPTAVIGTPWTASTAYTIGQQVSYGSYLYTITSNGTSGTVAPTILGSIATIPVTSGGASYVTATINISTPDLSWGQHATAVPVIVGGVITSINVTYAGTGYTSVPTVTISSGTGSGAVVGTPTLTTASNGTTSVKFAGNAATADVVLQYGAGYTTAPAVSISAVIAGSGAGAYFTGSPSSATLAAIISNGQISGVQVIDGGVGYTYANIVVSGDGINASINADLSVGDISTLQANTELLTVDGRVFAYSVVSSGYGYGTDFPLIITGDGTGAKATARVLNGAIVDVTVVSYGAGYRWMNVSLANGTGFGGKIRPILSPFGGHGKDSITQLFSNTLMFYTNISKDTNQGFTINNDYRQLGVLKDPSLFGSYGNLKSILASTCYVITGGVDVSRFTPDMMIYLDDARFRIVSSTATGCLIQSLDNVTPIIGSNFTDRNGGTITVAGVSNPTADKYSGDILFIDNKPAFTPTSDQNVTLRTVIKF